MQPRIMYVENKVTGEAHIGRCTFSRSGKCVYYRDKQLQRLPKGGIDGNHFDVATNEEYWISGPKKNGGDRRYTTPIIHIDENVRVEYWSEIRQLPENCRIEEI